MSDGAEGFTLRQPVLDGFHVFITGYLYQTEKLAFRDDLRAKSRIWRVLCWCEIRQYSDPMVSHTKGIDLDSGHVAADAALRSIHWTDGRMLLSRQRMTAQANADRGL